MNIPIPTGENLPFQKTQNVLAIKAINETLTERIITFADPRFASAAQEKVNTARENFKYLRGQGKEPPTEEIIRSKEFQQADRFLTDNIFWREGTYHLEIEISGRELKTQHREVFEVTLAGRDIEDLQANLQLVREDLQNQITKGDRPRPQWIYIHPPIRPAME